MFSWQNECFFDKIDFIIQISHRKTTNSFGQHSLCLEHHRSYSHDIQINLRSWHHSYSNQQFTQRSLIVAKQNIFIEIVSMVIDCSQTEYFQWYYSSVIDETPSLATILVSDFLEEKIEDMTPVLQVTKVIKIENLKNYLIFLILIKQLTSGLFDFNVS